MEDIDPPRQRPGTAQAQLSALAHFGMHSDEPVLWQSTRSAAYAQALETLRAAGRIFHCDCSRGRIAAQQDAAEVSENLPAYPGTCRARGLEPRQSARLATRMRVAPGVTAFTDRAHGTIATDVARTSGDFVVRRADGLWAYQLAVVVDDAYQGISDVVRGADLLGSTARQIQLQQALGTATPRYLHVPLVMGEDGRKLSKHRGAQALDEGDPLAELERAWQHLGFAPTGASSVAGFQDAAIAAWRARWVVRSALSTEGTSAATSAAKTAPEPS